MATLVDMFTVPAVDPIEMTAPSTSSGVRLRRRSPGVTGGFVDGGWWSRSLDLSIELPRLLAERYSAGYDVHRVEGRRTQEVASISLVETSGWRRVCLVVIPAQTDPVSTQQALTLAGLDGVHRADEILECANRPVSPPVIHTGEIDRLSLANWETDGGRVVASPTASPPA
jgi:hypothetical protein